MAKQGEIEYLARMDEHAIHHAIHKPFSDPLCPAYLMQMGAVMGLLPPPPGRLLDVGCGTGWTSRFFARWGYDVLGVDICPDMIDLANRQRDEEGLDNLHFLVSDYEDMRLEADFDCAVFYDALHHALDEEAALDAAYKALKPGGVCLTSEPGKGHSRAQTSVEAVQRFNVTERDMPPGLIIRAGRKAGFRQFKVYPHASELGNATYNYSGRCLRHLARRSSFIRKCGSLALVVRLLLYRAYRAGIVVLVK